VVPLVLDVLLNTLPQLLRGLESTLILTTASLILGSIMGILMAVGRTFGHRIISTLIYLYEKIFRGIPLLVIFFIIYFGLSQVGINLEPIIAAIIGLGLRSAAYQAQIFRASLNSIPEGQTIAAQSLGMSKLQTIRYILLPQVLRLSIPGWSNEFTIVLKDTSIAFSIGVIELMRQGRYIYVLNPDLILPILLLIALIYFVLVISINKSLGYLEKKYKMKGFDLTVGR
jgi:polar amino acid transport system permease protein